MLSYVKLVKRSGCPESQPHSLSFDLPSCYLLLLVNPLH